MVMAHDHPTGALEPREPTVEDLRDLCRELNAQGAKYIVISGFAMRTANYIRRTMDIELLAGHLQRANVARFTLTVPRPAN